MTYKLEDLPQGDSYDLEFGLKNRRDLVTPDVWTCQFQVRDSDDVAVIDRTITDLSANNQLFQVRITATESETLDVGDYIVSAQLHNPTTDQSVEIAANLTITKQNNY